MSALQSNIPQEQATGISPVKFIVWLFVISISMIFLALSSAYIVRKAEGNWLEFDLPIMFVWSTLVIIASSGTLILADKSAAKSDLKMSQIWIVLTILLGLSFAFFQRESWRELMSEQVFFTGPTQNPSGSFVYVFVWVHLFHIVTGLGYLGVVLFRILKNKLAEETVSSIKNCSVYWHFLGVVWLYLYVFLYLNH